MMFDDNLPLKRIIESCNPIYDENILSDLSPSLSEIQECLDILDEDFSKYL